MKKKMVLLTIGVFILGTAGLAQASIDKTVEVTTNPLWTDTYIDVSINDIVTIVPDIYDTWHTSGSSAIGPSGAPINTWDVFTNASLHSSLIAYIGSDPFQGHWGNSSFFPQATGYIGVNNGITFTSTQNGRLWLGVNDDAVSKGISDNWGSITTNISVNTVPIPASILLLGSGILGMSTLGFRRVTGL